MQQLRDTGLITDKYCLFIHSISIVQLSAQELGITE